MIGQSVVRLKCWWPTHSLTHFFTNSWLPNVGENAFVLDQDYLHFGPELISWQEETNTKQRTLSWTKHSQAIHKRYLYIQTDKHKRRDWQAYKQPESRIEDQEILRRKCHLYAFAICKPPNFLSVTCAFLPLMATSASSFGGFPMEKFVLGHNFLSPAAPAECCFYLHQPTSHSRGNWKKSKRLNLISGRE